MQDIIAEYGTSDDRETPLVHVLQTTVLGEKSTPISQMARAQLILKNKNCVYQDNLKTSVVQNTSGTHAAKLFPKESCTCPAKKECYHMIPAKLYMGMEVKNKTRKITMTQLRRNIRPKSSKRKGRKDPLTEDGVEAAPDVKVHKRCDLTIPVSEQTALVSEDNTTVQEDSVI